MSVTADDTTNPGTGTAGSAVSHLCRGDTSLLLHLATDELPRILHWGPALSIGAEDDVVLARTRPVTDSALTMLNGVGLLPLHSAGWLGRPGLLGSRNGRAWSVRFESMTHQVHDAGTTQWPEGATGAVRVRSIGEDLVNELTLETELELHPSGLIRVRATVCNLSADPYEIAHLEPALPVPSTATELLDFTGRHNHERHPQRRPFDMGTWRREAWGGRPGHDGVTMLCAGTTAFAFRTGRVHGVHVAWSGNQVAYAEHAPSGRRLLRGGELLLPGEVILAQGERYTSPWLVGSWGDGLDALSQRVHRYLRSRPEHPTTPRPVLLNTWEAVFFDHQLDRLKTLADRAAEVGIERFVLDDGWFLGRRNDRAGLGDWDVDPDVWPDGLHPLVDHVRALGMEFGLWVEPEMVTLNSRLAKEHPDWLLATGHGPGIPSRYQHVLDLGHREAFDHLAEKLSALVGEYGIGFLKWDHNRPLVDAGHQPGGVPGVHAQTLATYDLMRLLKRRHPGLEIESCAGGGGRIDLGIAQVSDRFWVSDCIDAHERHRAVRWTEVLMPPELLGTHIGSGDDHTTGRRHPLAFRAGTALWGHLGVEWDLARAGEEDLCDLAAWIAFHKQHRHLLHTGDIVRADLTDPALHLDGVVAQDGSEALYRLSALDHTVTMPGPVTLPGLDSGRRYRVSVPDISARALSTRIMPPWATTGIELSGAALGEIGIQAPTLDPDQLVILDVQSL